MLCVLTSSFVCLQDPIHAGVSTFSSWFEQAVFRWIPALKGEGFGLGMHDTAENLRFVTNCLLCSILQGAQALGLLWQRPAP